ncbi:unnamed protein product, partial [Amoebophrya sp. A25]|eukprot:GSA25T00001452001.1
MEIKQQAVEVEDDDQRTEEQQQEQAVKELGHMKPDSDGANLNLLHIHKNEEEAVRFVERSNDIFRIPEHVEKKARGLAASVVDHDEQRLTSAFLLSQLYQQGGGERRETRQNNKRDYLR